MNIFSPRGLQPTDSLEAFQVQRSAYLNALLMMCPRLMDGVFQLGFSPGEWLIKRFKLFPYLDASMSILDKYLEVFPFYFDAQMKEEKHTVYSSAKLIASTVHDFFCKREKEQGTDDTDKKIQLLAYKVLIESKGARLNLLETAGKFPALKELEKGLWERDLIFLETRAKEALKEAADLEKVKELYEKVIDIDRKIERLKDFQEIARRLELSKTQVEESLESFKERIREEDPDRRFLAPHFNSIGLALEKCLEEIVEAMYQDDFVRAEVIEYDGKYIYERAKRDLAKAVPEVRKKAYLDFFMLKKVRIRLIKFLLSRKNSGSVVEEALKQNQKLLKTQIFVLEAIINGRGIYSAQEDALKVKMSIYRLIDGIQSEGGGRVAPCLEG